MKNIVETIIKLNKNLWSSNIKFKKINICFTNAVYDINNQYIIKICTNKENEQSFINKINFYLNNPTNPSIPKLLNYNTRKKEIPYIYEILEKLQSESLCNV